MAARSATEAQSRAQRIRDLLREREEVQAVFLEPDDERLWIICSGRYSPDQLEPELSDAIEAAGLERAGLDVRCVDGAVGQVARRVRLVDVERFDDDESHVRVRVTLEWNGDEHVGEAKGERSRAIELRTAAAAAVSAVEKVTSEDLRVRLVGVKQFRAFDKDLVAVSLYRLGDREQHLVGTVLQNGTAARAAAAAVLSALNRALGNYLIRLD